MPSQPSFTWNWDPVVLLGVVALALGYYAAIGPLRERHHLGVPATRRQIAFFAIGIASLVLTLITPLDALGRTALFSAHMLQLMLLNTLVAPFLIMGLPQWLVRAALGPLARLVEDGSLLLWGMATLIFNGTILLWHAGPFYEAGLHNEAVRDIEMLTILLTGTVRWWPVLTPSQPHTRLASPGQILYVLLESLPLDIFAIALLFAQAPLYATYASGPHLWGMSAMLDQQVAGCIALIPGTFIDVVIMSVIFFAWFRRMEREQEAEDERLAALEQVR